MAEEERVHDFAKSFEALRDDLVELKKLNDQAQERREVFKYREGKCKELEDRIVEKTTEAIKEYHFSISRNEFIDIFRYAREGRNLFDLRVKWYFMTTNSLILYARRWSEMDAVSMELEDIKGRIEERERHANLRAEECFRLRWLSVGEC
jgi:chromosome segregation ATPase